MNPALSWHNIALVLALVLFFLSAVGVPGGRFSLVSAGLFFWCLSTAI